MISEKVISVSGRAVGAPAFRPGERVLEILGFSPGLIKSANRNLPAAHLIAVERGKR